LLRTNGYAMAASMGWAHLGTLSTVLAGRWGGQIWVLTGVLGVLTVVLGVLTGVLGVRSQRAGGEVRYVAGVSWNDAIDVASCQRHFACAYLQSSKAKDRCRCFAISRQALHKAVEAPRPCVALLAAS
jgi:hypothetical protein